MNKNLYRLYLFLLPFGTLFQLKRVIHSNIWNYLSLSDMIMFVGMFMPLLTRSIDLFDKAIVKWTKLIIFMIIYTFICCIIVDAVWGDINGESPFSVMPHNIFLLVKFLFTIIFNYKYLSRFFDIKEITAILKYQSMILLSVGIIQYLAIGAFGGALAINEILSHVFCLRDNQYLLSVGKGITLFETEPAHVSAICFWLIPFIFFNAIQHRKTYIIQSILWSFLLFNSGSSLVIISFLTVIVCVGTIYIKNKIPSIYMKSCFGLGLLMALTYTHADLGSNSIVTSNSKFEYVVYGKVFDVENGSTAVRASTVVNDIKVFEEYPITGIGYGLQGYKFNQNAPDWVRNNYLTQSMLSGELGLIEGGGNFFPNFLSAFGLIGLFFLFAFYKEFKKDIRLMDNTIIIQNTFYMGVCIFLYSAWFSEGLTSYTAFLFSLPYSALLSNNEGNH